MADDNTFGQLAEALSAVVLAEADGLQRQVRLSRKRNTITEPSVTARQRQALDGRYFTFLSPTPSTSIAIAINTAFDATKGLFCIFNNSTSDVIMDFLKLIVETAPASATALHIASFLDNANQFTSGGAALTPQNMNENSAETGADVTVNFGDLVIAAASTGRRRHGRAVPRSVIPVVKDEIILQFGQDVASGSDDTGGTVAKRCVIPMAPAIIGPGHSLVINPWLPSNAVTAAKFEVEGAYYKR